MTWRDVVRADPAFGLRAVIPAAGRATRFGLLQKCLQPLGTGVVLDRAIELALELSPDVLVAVPTGQGEIAAAIVHEDERVRWTECEAGLGQCRTIQLLLGQLAPIAGPVIVVFGDDVSPVGEAVQVATPLVDGGAWATQCVVWEDDTHLLSDACRIELIGSRITSVTEKPEQPTRGWRGCAVYGLSVGAALEMLSARCGEGDVLASHFNRWIEESRPVHGLPLAWNVNVNRPADLRRAQWHLASG